MVPAYSNWSGNTRSSPSWKNTTSGPASMSATATISTPSEAASRSEACQAPGCPDQSSAGVSTLIELREHQLTEESLTSDQALALQGCGLIDVQPAWSDGRWRLKARAIVGTLDLGDGLTVRVNPKLEIRRVVYLLCHAAGLASWDDHLVDLDEDAPIDLALAEAFATAAERTLSRGPRSSVFH